MDSPWRDRQRPLLVKLVSDFDLGVTSVDAAAYAAALGLAGERVGAEVAALQDAGFIEARLRDSDLVITRVCPLARQIIGHASPTMRPVHAGGTSGDFDEL